ncbi:uncharacterized protein DDB_G0271670-like [Chenopodium quinoa]|uniref:uncharacterized protein DDB_G0271670-like n=1 Tax=Chenopodium quinoa TaxID=63459 RepID=UPI000B78C928|nr:uncharacterized protein DDB_G0271670-like [Chenopodium quinoa]
MAVDDDMCSDGMQCTDHPYRTTSPGGGICAFCLQDKLGKLVSTSSSSFLINSSSSSSPSFRSDLPSSATSAATATTSLSISIPTASNSRNYNHHYNQHRHNNNFQKDHSTSRPRIPFLLTQKKKKKDDVQSSSYSPSNSVLKRSKSSATPRSTRFLEDFSPRRRGFWSFLHISNTHHKKPTTIVTPSSTTTVPPENTTAVMAVTAEVTSSAAVKPDMTSSEAAAVVVDETDESPNSSGGASNTASFGRKVSRSRSVGCGSRSFSGDFFERISTGFGDCTLRRVESHREGSKHRHSTSRAAGDTVREKVRCGGLFGGLIITSSSSSTTSSSSSYWGAGDGRPNGPTVTPAGPLVHGRSRSWGWAFASPMRAFAKPTTTRYDRSREPGGGGGDGSVKNSNGTPNLAAIPSLLSIRGVEFSMKNPYLSKERKC